MFLSSASKLPSKWMLSGALAVASLELMQHTILQIIKIYCYSPKLPGTVGDMVSDIYCISISWDLGTALKIGCSCCLDADIKQDIGNDFLFHCVGKAHQPGSPSRYNHDQSRSGANCRAPGCLPKKPNIFVHVARITRDSIAFRNNRIPRALG